MINEYYINLTYIQITFLRIVLKYKEFFLRKCIHYLLSLCFHKNICLALILKGLYRYVIKKKRVYLVKVGCVVLQLIFIILYQSEIFYFFVYI